MSTSVDQNYSHHKAHTESYKKHIYGFWIRPKLFSLCSLLCSDIAPGPLENLTFKFKKSNSGLIFHFRSSENSKNGLSMGNKDKKVIRKFANCGSYGVFLKKNVKKKVKMLHAGVFLKKEKKEKYSAFP